MGQNRREIGSTYEKIAGEYLEQNGYKILEYNVYSHAGEIDIVAKDGTYLVFVEVKYRKDETYGDPMEALTKSKCRTLSNCALSYLKKHRLWDVPIRFDVIGILGDEIRLIKNAFEFCGRRM